MSDNSERCLESPLRAMKTVSLASGDTDTLSAAEAEEMKQLAMLLEELDRELGESDDPDLLFAAAFAKQCALGYAAD